MIFSYFSDRTIWHLKNVLISLEKGYLSVDAEESGGGGGDVAFEDEVLDDG